MLIVTLYTLIIQLEEQMENNLKKTKDSLSIQINKRVVIEND